MKTIAITDESYLVRKGFLHLLKEYNNTIELLEFESHIALEDELRNRPVDIILINHKLLLNYQSKDSLLSYGKTVLSTAEVRGVDADILLNASKAELLKTIDGTINNLNTKEVSDSEELSSREKLVLQQISLGLQNKEIADKLCISTHTVMSHRKNITRKLGIKTVSGLTVYALLNKLIDLEDIKM